MRLTELIDFITREDIPLNPRVANTKRDLLDHDELSIPGDTYTHLLITNRYRRMRYNYQKARREHARLEGITKQSP